MMSLERLKISQTAATSKPALRRVRTTAKSVVNHEPLNLGQMIATALTPDNSRTVTGHRPDKFQTMRMAIVFEKP